MNPPGTNNYGKLTTANGGTKNGLAINKRKSKTPKATAKRRSIRINNAAAAASMVADNETTMTSTKSCNFYEQADVTIKSGYSTQSSNDNYSTHSTSNAFGWGGQKSTISTYKFTASITNKHPPKSLSSKYNSNYNSNKFLEQAETIDWVNFQTLFNFFKIFSDLIFECFSSPNTALQHPTHSSKKRRSRTWRTTETA